MDSDRDFFQTPIVLIVFNRPELTRAIFARIRNLKPRNLFIISDGARVNINGEKEKVIEVRKIFDSVDWDCNLKKNYSDINLGGKKRISSGLSWVFSLVSEAIILEDDCLPAHSFFKFCEEMLSKYRGDHRIGMISGDNYWPDEKISRDSYGFTKYMLTWGWATWRDRWSSFDYAIKDWPKAKEAQILNNLFKKKIEIAYWKRIFDESYEDTNDAYDYCWVFTNWIQSRLCIFPRVNLISNVGFGAGATNTTNNSHHLAHYPLCELEFPLVHPNIVAPNYRVERKISRILYSITVFKWFRTKIRELYYVDFFVRKLKILLGRS